MTVRIPSIEDKQLVVDKARCGGKHKETGITIKDNLVYEGKPYTSAPVDIAYLDTASLGKYLRSKGGRNDLAEDIVKKLLDHPIERLD
jgi:hypothetical protein